jgi:replicative DNA helicase
MDNMFTTTDDSVFTLEATSRMLFELVNKNMSGSEELTGTPTGFSKLDAKGGLHPSDLVIVAGESSQGKTSFSNSIVLNAIQKGAKVAFYSMEMTKVQLTARLAAMMSGVSSSDLLYSTNLSQEQLQRFDSALGALSGYQLYFDDKSTSNIEGILASIRSLKMKYDIDGVVVDYLQILNVNSKNSNKEQAMADAARRLKNIAKDLNIWVIALSQLNRDSNNPQPNLNRLRDSGQIAEAADMVMFVYRPEYYGKSFPEPFESESTKGKAMIDVAKGRNIGTMRFLTRFHAPLTLFEDIREGETINPLPPSDMPF